MRNKDAKRNGCIRAQVSNEPSPKYHSTNRYYVYCSGWFTVSLVHNWRFGYSFNTRNQWSWWVNMMWRWFVLKSVHCIVFFEPWALNATSCVKFQVFIYLFSRFPYTENKTRKCILQRGILCSPKLQYSLDALIVETNVYFYDNSILFTKGEKRDFIDECEFSVRVAGERARARFFPVVHALFFYNTWVISDFFLGFWGSFGKRKGNIFYVQIIYIYIYKPKYP